MGKERVERVSVGCESSPIEWSDDPSCAQAFSAVRIVSLVQFVYAALSYGIQLLYLYAQSFGYYAYDDGIQTLDLIQPPWGISFLTIIGALVLRLRVDAQKSITITIIYIFFILLDLLAWAARTGYIIYQMYPLYHSDSPLSLDDNLHNVKIMASQLFVAILLIVGLVDGMKVVSKGSKQRYSLLLDNNNNNNDSAASSDYHPLSSLCVIQLAYTLLRGVLPLIFGLVLSSGVSPILHNSAAGLFTIISTIAVFLRSCGTTLPTYYAIMLSIDFITGIIRTIADVANNYTSNTCPLDSCPVGYYVILSYWVLFPLFYWVLGIVVAYKTKIFVQYNLLYRGESEYNSGY